MKKLCKGLFRTYEEEQVISPLVGIPKKNLISWSSRWVETRGESYLFPQYEFEPVMISPPFSSLNRAFKVCSFGLEYIGIEYLEICCQMSSTKR